MQSHSRSKSSSNSLKNNKKIDIQMNWKPHIFLFLGLRMCNNNRLHAMDFPPYGMAVYIHITRLSFIFTWPT